MDHYKLAIHDLLGPVLIAVALNAFFYGVCFVLFINYYRSGKFEGYSLPVRLTVCWVFTVDTVHTGSSIYLVWFYTVRNFGNFNVLDFTPWPYSAPPLFIALVIFPIRQFFTWRIQGFCRSWLIFGLLSLLSLASSGLGLATSGLGLEHPGVGRVNGWLWLIDLWLGVSLACDALIAGYSLYHITTSRTGSKEACNPAMRLVETAVETAALNPLVSLADLIVFNATRKTNYHYLLSMPIGCIYTISLLTLLNLEESSKQESGRVTDIDIHNRNVQFRSFVFSKDDVCPPEVNVVVGQSITQSSLTKMKISLERVPMSDHEQDMSFSHHSQEDKGIVF